MTPASPSPRRAHEAPIAASGCVASPRAPLASALVVALLALALVFASSLRSGAAYAQTAPPPPLGDETPDAPPIGDEAPDAPKSTLDPLDEDDDDDGAESYFFAVWGVLHGGYLTGLSDRFEDGSQGFFGGAFGISILVIDVFMDIRVDGFDVETSGMWNQLGVGVSFGIPISIVKLVFGARVAYLYAQYNEAARAAFEAKFVAGDREEEPSQRGLNISAQAGVDIKIAGPLYFTTYLDVGYHILLPAVQHSHGINFSLLGGLKLVLGI